MCGLQLKTLGLAVIKQWSAAGRNVLASTVAGALAWLIAQTVFGHPHPVFAAIVAIVCLAPGLPSHARQALGLLIGVGIGIAIGELALVFPDDIPLLRGTAGVFVAMMFASSFGLGPVVPIQAGVSTILVLVLGPQTAGYVRMIDSAVGIVVALIVSQFLLTPDPVDVVEKAARTLLQELSSGFSQCDAAIATADRKIAKAAMEKISAAHDSVVALNSSISWARHAASWSLRGRFVASEVSEVASRYDGRAIRLYASTLLFSEALIEAIRESEAPPCLRERVHEVAELYRDIAAGKAPEQGTRPSSISIAPVPQNWQSCITPLQALEGALRAFAPSADRRAQSNW
jgi:uncharacterized membrane protein YgaE (UPF0421/DUF939 family)